MSKIRIEKIVIILLWLIGIIICPLVIAQCNHTLIAIHNAISVPNRNYTYISSSRCSITDWPPPQQQQLTVLLYLLLLRWITLHNEPFHKFIPIRHTGKHNKFDSPPPNPARPCSKSLPIQVAHNMICIFNYPAKLCVSKALCHARVGFVYLYILSVCLRCVSDGSHC